MAWVLQSDGTYLSDSSSFQTYAEGGGWKLRNLNVDDSRFLSYDELLNFPLVQSGSLPSPYNDNIILGAGYYVEAGSPGFVSRFNGDLFMGAGRNINLSAPGVILHDSVPVSGFLDNGTPFFTRRYTFTIAPLATSATFAHGIPNARTNRRLLGYDFTCRTSSLPSQDFLFGVLNTGITPNDVLFTDTNITFNTTSASGTRDFIFYLRYI